MEGNCISENGSAMDKIIYKEMFCTSEVSFLCLEILF